MNNIILDLCGGTGAWSQPYKDAGFKVYNITFPEFDYLLKEELEEIRSISDIEYKNAKTRKALRSITPPNFAKAFFEANSRKEDVKK